MAGKRKRQGARGGFRGGRGERERRYRMVYSATTKMGSNITTPKEKKRNYTNFR